MLGTRGAALIVLINIAWNLVTGRNSKKVIARILVLFAAVITFVSSSLFDSAVLWLYMMAQKVGLSIRIFDKILGGSQGGTSGRDLLTEKLMVSVKEHFLFGTGLCSDRVLVGTYAHNILVELWVDFGVIIGTVLLAWMVYTFIQSLCKVSNTEEKGLIVTLICASFMKLFLSSTYLDTAFLFLLIGLCVGTNRKATKNDSGIAQS